MENNNDSIEDVVLGMNSLLYEKYRIEDYGFVYESNGFASYVSFSGLIFWSSEDDGPQEGETYEQAIWKKFVALQKIIGSIEQ